MKNNVAIRIGVSSLCALLLYAPSHSGAATSPAKTAVQPVVQAPVQILNGAGVVRGGSAANYVTLLDVRRSQDVTKKIERIVVDWGDQALYPAANAGYYTIESKMKPPRVQINLAMALNNRFDVKSVLGKLSNGIWIKTARLEFDPISQSQNLLLELRKPVRLQVRALPGVVEGKTIDQHPARLVVDFVQ